VSCWTVAGERQATRLRSLYLKAVLRQDIAFFDVEMTTADAASRMSADTVLIQDALGEKVTLFFFKEPFVLMWAFTNQAITGSIVDKNSFLIAHNVCLISSK
jgi:ABC-type multidrug transport system fused ATPase/permease subunit